jgi:uncharacterized membrane protein YfcA
MIFIIFFTGIFAGILSGLLGIGGGVVIVPVLSYFDQAFPGLNHAQIMHLAVGTSLASMIFTTLSGVISHLRYGHFVGISPSIFRGLIPGLWLGAWVGNLLNSLASFEALKIIFMIVAIVIAIRMIFSPHLFFHKERKHYSTLVFCLIGVVIGSVSSLIGIGGGVFLVPILAYMGLPPSQVSAATSIGTFCSVSMGTIGSIYFGWHSILQGQEWVTGYVYWPWAVLIGVAGMMMAPLGVWLSRRLPVSSIRKLFALILVLVAVRMGFN